MPWNIVTDLRDKIEDLESLIDDFKCEVDCFQDDLEDKYDERGVDQAIQAALQDLDADDLNLDFEYEIEKHLNAYLSDCVEAAAEDLFTSLEHDSDTVDSLRKVIARILKEGSQVTTAYASHWRRAS